jgi:integrase
LARARTLAVEALSRAEGGEDPRHNPTGTVSELAGLYLAEHVARLRSAKAVERRINKNVLPLIGSVSLGDLHKRDVNRVLTAIRERGSPTEAARVFEDVRAMLRWGVARGDLDFNPAEGMRKPTTPLPRERVLSDDELRTLWETLPGALPRSLAVQRIIRLCLLTAQRVGEVSGMHRDELDLDARVWTIPSSRSKNKHAHRVPLSDAAIAVITASLNGGHLFPNDNGRGPLAGHAVAKTIRLAQERFGLDHWTAHDLRRTAVTNMASLGVSPIVLGHVINHISVTKAGVTLSVYSHYDYAKEKREALDLWAAHLDAVVRGDAKVVPLRAS